MAYAQSGRGKYYQTWRNTWAPIIRQEIENFRGKQAQPPYDVATRKEIRAALRARWRAMGQPCRYWPYKVWCDETRRQLGLRPARLIDAREGKERRCPLCWTWHTALRRWQHDPKCMACNGTGYRQIEMFEGASIADANAGERLGLLAGDGVALP
jgi:hypothetical protein